MLTLGVKAGEYIVIGDNIVVQVIEMDGRTHLNIEAPREVAIQRAAIYEKNHPTPRCINKEKPA